MQGDAITVAAVDMGTHCGVLRIQEGREVHYTEVRGDRGCFVGGSGSWYECEVPLSPYLSLGLD